MDSDNGDEDFVANPPEESEPVTQIEEMKEITAEVEKNQSLSERFRKELEGYLDELDHKKSSDGEALIEVPENFDNIVQAMTRDDLLSADATSSKKEPGTGTGTGAATPWYECIIRDHVNKKLDKDFKGRYHKIFETSEEDHIRKGMAEILMLDRQLWLLSKKAQTLTSDPDADVAKLPPGSTPTTPGSRRHDRTFLTKYGTSPPKSSGTVASSSNSRNRPRSGFQSSRRATPRGGGGTDDPPPTTARSTLDNDEYSEAPGNNFDENNGPEDDNKDGESMEDMRRALKTARMTEAEQAKRLEDLLSLDDDTLQATFTYYPCELDAQAKAIDLELAQFGHLDRLQSTREIEEERKVIDSKDYLTQQRLERKRNQHAAKIDHLLTTYGSTTVADLLAAPSSSSSSSVSTAGPRVGTAASTMSAASQRGQQGQLLDVDLSALVAMAHRDTPPTATASAGGHTASSQAPESPQSTRRSYASRASFNPQLHEVPRSLDDIRPDVPITREDIDVLIHNLRAEYRREQVAPSSSSSRRSPRGSSSHRHRHGHRNRPRSNNDDTDPTDDYHRSRSRSGSRSGSDDSDDDDVVGSSARTSPRSSRPVTATTTAADDGDGGNDNGNVDEEVLDLQLDDATQTRIQELLADYADDIQRLSRLRQASRISQRLFAGESSSIPEPFPYHSTANTNASRPSSTASAASAATAAGSQAASKSRGGLAAATASTTATVSAKKPTAAAATRSTAASRAITSTIQQQTQPKKATANANGAATQQTAASRQRTTRGGSKGTATATTAAGSRGAAVTKSGKMLFASDGDADAAFDDDGYGDGGGGDFVSLPTTLAEPPAQRSAAAAAAAAAPPQLSSEFSPPRRTGRTWHPTATAAAAAAAADDHDAAAAAEVAFSRSDLQLHPDYPAAAAASGGRSTGHHHHHAPQPQQQQQLPRRPPAATAATAADVEGDDDDARALAALALRQQQRQAELAALQAERERLWASLMQQADKLDALQATTHTGRTANSDDDGDGDGDVDGDGDEEDNDARGDELVKRAQAAARAAMTSRTQPSAHANATANVDFEIENGSDSDGDGDATPKPRLRLPHLVAPTAAATAPPRDHDEEEDADDAFFYQQALRRLDLETQRAMQRSMQPLAHNPRVKQPTATSMATATATAPAGAKAPATAATVEIMRETLLNQVREYVEV